MGEARDGRRRVAARVVREDLAAVAAEELRREGRARDVVGRPFEGHDDAGRVPRDGVGRDVDGGAQHPLEEALPRVADGPRPRRRGQLRLQRAPGGRGAERGAEERRRRDARAQQIRRRAVLERGGQRVLGQPVGRRPRVRGAPGEAAQRFGGAGNFLVALAEAPRRPEDARLEERVQA